MLTRAVFGLATVLATVSGSLAAPRAQANNPPTVYDPSGAYIGVETGLRPHSESAPTVWGWRYTPPEAARQVKHTK